MVERRGVEEGEERDLRRGLSEGVSREKKDPRRKVGRRIAENRREDAKGRKRAKSRVLPIRSLLDRSCSVASRIARFDSMVSL